MNKMRNKPTEIDGIKFASKKEANRYKDLLLLQRAGEIVGLQLKARYKIEINGVHICYYESDFVYLKHVTETETEIVVEDVKGRKAGAAWEKFRIKQKLMKAVHGIDVVCV